MESGRALYFPLCSLLGSSPDLGGIKAIKLKSRLAGCAGQGLARKTGDEGISGKIVILDLSSSK
jgi:hypothetical protein